MGVSRAQPNSPSKGLAILPVLHSDSVRIGSALYLNGFGGWGSVAHGFNSPGDQFAWSIDLGAAIQLVDWSNEAWLIGVTNMELTATTNSPIYFNPKGGFWEEGLLYAHRAGDGFWEAGYLHRCRHDVDNGDTNEYRGIPSERTLIYGSLTAQYHFARQASIDPPLPVFLPWVGIDLYLVREDYRQPASAESALPNFQNILASISTGATYRNSLLYARAALGATAYGVDGSFFRKFSSISRVLPDVTLEVGITGIGEMATCEAFVGYQYHGDDASHPFPTSASFLTLGVRLRSNTMVE